MSMFFYGTTCEYVDSTAYPVSRIREVRVMYCDKSEKYLPAFEVTIDDGTIVEVSLMWHVNALINAGIEWQRFEPAVSNPEMSRDYSNNYGSFEIFLMQYYKSLSQKA